MTQWGIDTLFNPSKRHMDEEKRRLQTTREQIGDSSGGRRIDLESGKVTIRKSDEDAESEPKKDRKRSERIEAARQRRARQKAAGTDQAAAG